MDEYKPSGRDLVVIALWIKQATLLMAIIAAMTAMAASRYAENSWLTSVKYAFISSVLTTAAGTLLGRMVLEQAVNSRVKIKSPGPE